MGPPPPPCCYAEASAKQKKCCQCGFRTTCNAGGGCLNTCGWPSCVNNRLNRNRFEEQIKAEKNDLYALNARLKTLQTEYESYTPPQVPGNVDISCCQSAIFSNISGNAVKFDTVTMKCPPVPNSQLSSKILNLQNIQKNLQDLQNTSNILEYNKDVRAYND